jgi:NAD(P)-dependent dehydrogenase (short-subunit alcohol dehydrogenase family)
MQPADDAHGPLAGKVALAAGATRGAGRAIAVELARAGSVRLRDRAQQPGHRPLGHGASRDDRGDGRPHAAGRRRGRSPACRPPGAGRGLRSVGRIDREQGQLDLLVNDIFGGDRYAEWDKKLWEHDLDGGLRMLRMGVDTHLITCTKALPLVLRGDGGLVVEMTDGTSEFNSSFRKGVGFYYDLVKANVERITIGLTAELAGTSCTAVAVTPGWLRSERMLENFGVTEDTWRDALEETPHFCISETPAYVARGIVALASDPDLGRHAGRVLSSAELARTYGVTDTDGTQPDCWRYLVEIQLPGRPATEQGYR